MKIKLSVLLFLVSCASHTGVKVDSENGVGTKIKMAITVDDLPFHGATLEAGKSRLDVATQMVNGFKKNSISGVYGFVNGYRIDADPKLAEVVKFWIDSGNNIGNHTYSHKNLNEVSVGEYESEIAKNEKFLETSAKETDWKYFRYTFLKEGETLEKRNAIRDYLGSKGYKIAQVTVDFKDWAWNEAYGRCVAKKDQQEIKLLKESYLKNAMDQFHRSQKVTNALFKRQVSHVLLIHIGPFSAEMIDDLIHAFEKEGVEFVSLAEAQKDPMYSIDPALGSQWGAELQYRLLQSRHMSTVTVGLEPREEYPKTLLNITCL